MLATWIECARRVNPVRIARKTLAPAPNRPDWANGRARFWLAAGLVLAAGIVRLLPHPMNFAPIGAMALFGGAHFPKKRWAFCFPLAALFAGDLAQHLVTGRGFHELMPAVYGSFAAVVLLGFLLRSRRGMLRIGVAACAGSALFFAITNFAVWAMLDTYPPTAAGLAACYLAALPLLGNTLAGDLSYAALLFGGFALAGRRWPVFAIPTAAGSTEAGPVGRSGRSLGLRAAGMLGVLVLGVTLLPVQPKAQADSESAAPGDGGPIVAEEVVVTATRVETPLKELASSVTVITAEEIEERQATELVEVLRGTPGLDVVQPGGAGSLTSVFIRGAESNHTLVLIDGIPINDPIFNRAVDFADLDLANVERIEIVRGPQSTLYGSNAIGGVINIVTKRGEGPPVVTVSAEAGSYETLNSSAGISGGMGIFDYSLTLSRRSTAGISVASEARGNSERDGFSSNTAAARLGLEPTEMLRIDLILRATDSEKELDEDFGLGIEDDPNFDSETKRRYYRLQGRLALFGGLWEQTLGYSVADHHRSSRNDPDADHASSSRSTLDATLTKADWQHNLFLHETNTVVLGVETQEERGSSTFRSESPLFGSFENNFTEKSATIDSLYIMDQLAFADSFFATVGVRVDEHSRFGEEQTERVTAAYLLPGTGTKLKATYGTGFSAPTLFELFSPDFGNRKLKPERSVGWDAGVEQSFFGRELVLDYTYFNNEFEELIDFDPDTFRSVNVAKAEAHGYEWTVSIVPAATFRADLGFTRTVTEDKSTGRSLLRRPENKFSVNLAYRPVESLRFGLHEVHVGERRDLDFSMFPAKRVTLEAYTLVTLTAAWEILEGVRLFGRVENLLDEEYEEAFGFGSRGQAFFAGAGASF
ncbi:MAG: TonB-dependent receptor [SAR324 cluster bacterium]|nr:TonB-dependent receptor [SAR324 cluster bacterium]